MAVRKDSGVILPTPRFPRYACEMPDRVMDWAAADIITLCIRVYLKIQKCWKIR